MSPIKTVKLGDVCLLPLPRWFEPSAEGLPNNARAKVIATYIDTTYVLFEGKDFIVPNACVHDGSEDGALQAA